MIPAIALKTQVYELNIDISALPYDVYDRIDQDTIWNDLWTDNSLYDPEVEAANEGWGINSILNWNGEPKLPKQIIFFGWFDLLEKTELPSNHLGWTIISKRFLGVVKQLGFTHYRLINLRIIDRAQFKNVFDEPNIRKYEDNNAAQHLRHSDDMFYGFQVLSRASLLTEDSDDTNRMGKKVTWRDDIPELPFFFYESRFPGVLLVNQEARDALEKAGIRGIQFSPAFE
jgi:hypothetical protein